MAKKRRHRRGGRTTPKGTRPPGTQPGRSDRQWEDDGPLASVTPLFPPSGPPGPGAGRLRDEPDLDVADDAGLDDGAALMFELMADCLDLDHPGELLTLASTMASFVDPRNLEADARQEDLVEEMDAFVTSLLGTGHREPIGMARALAELAASPPVRDRAAAVTGDRSDLPGWLRRLGPVTAPRAAELVDDRVLGECVLVELAIGDRVLTAVIVVDFVPDPAVVMAYLAPLGLKAALAGLRVEGVDGGPVEDPGAPRVADLAPADARARIEQALAGGAVPPVDGEEVDGPSWPEPKLLVEWVVRQLPTGGQGYRPGHGVRSTGFAGLPREVVDIYRRSLEEAAGGADALGALDDDPLPDEAFDWTGIADDVRDRVAEVLVLLDTFADERFDAEVRTAQRRLLARVARGGPEVFRRRGAASSAAAAVAWLVARDNNLLERRRGGFTAKDLAAAFGRSGSVSGRADTLVRTAGLATSAHGFRGGTDLLIGRARAHLVHQRDLLDEWATLAAENAQLRSELGLAPSPDDVRPVAPTGLVHRLKVTLTGTKPPVWRRLVVPSDVTLGDLHEVLQAAFEWSDLHLHEFEVGGRRYAPADDPLDDWGPSIGPPTVDEETVTLATVARAGDRFTYTYDFGDDWRHRIEVEAVSPPEEGRSYPGCLGGRRAAPPEDIGGPPGFESFLAALAALGDPTHGRYDDRYGGPFDPTDFDVDELDEFLGSLRFD